MHKTYLRRFSGYSRIGDEGGHAWTWLTTAFVFAVSILLATVVVSLSVAFLSHTLNERPLPPAQLRLNAVQNSTDPKRPISGVTLNQILVSTPLVADADIATAYKAASQEISPDRYDLIADAAEGGCPFNFTRSTATFEKMLNVPGHRFNGTMDIRALALEGEVQERTTFIIKDKYRFERHHIAALRANGTGRRNQHCAKQMQLVEHRGHECTKNQTYRSYDGVCNNPRYPLRGAAYTQYARGLPAFYADGISTPRVSSKDGSPLPPVRTLSNEIHTSGNSSHSKNYTVLMTFWGQFVTHDISKTLSSLKSGDCCSKSANVSECLPIMISQDDKFYSKFGVRCFAFSRSQPAPQSDCALGPREHINQLTSFLDGSAIYGSSVEEALRLRRFRNGHLNASFADGTMLLPVQTEDTEACTQDKKDPFCFVGGDSRCDENLSILSLHTLWLREHNRLSSLLSTVNPSWDDDRLFEEARRIVIAEFQHITYSEYLPLLIGRKMMDEFGLQKVKSGYVEDYSKEVDPSVSNEFAVSAMRFGHTAVPDEWNFVTDRSFWKMQLHEGLFLPSMFSRDNDTFASLLFGTSVQSAPTIDSYYSTQLTNHLFETKTSRYGCDLASINTQRGRDHGIPPYNAFREYCGLPRLRSFLELENVFIDAVAGRFAKLYKSVDDIDLHTGGLSERPMSGSQLGPVLTCIIADQFARLRQGDRYWYENGNHSSPNPFSMKQLTQIRRVTLARLVCDNVPNIRALPSHLFLLPSKKNVPGSCDSGSIPALDIKAWKE